MSYDKECCSASKDVVKKERMYREACKVAELVEQAAIVARARAYKALEELNKATEAMQPVPSPAPAPCLPVLEGILMAQEVEENHPDPPPAPAPPQKRKWTNWSNGCPDDVPKDVHDEWLHKKKGSKNRFKQDWELSQKRGFPIGMYKSFVERNRRNNPPPYQRVDRGPPVICNLSDSSSSQ